MAELDTEILERVARWCAEAGRQTGPGEIRAALSPLAWDEQLRVRALLADPPPARPLGPFALVELARGVPADEAAQHEAEGRHRYEEEEAREDTAQAPDAPAEKVAPEKRKLRAKKGPAIVIRRARDRTPEPAPAAPRHPRLEELFQPEGRGVLEALIREHGARRGPITAALAAGWVRGDDSAPGDEELSDLLEEHGLARAFERRERDELLHALRASGGVVARAAAKAGTTPDGFREALARLGATGDAERIRDERRAELRGQATLSDRARLLLEERERLADLGLEAEIADDLRARLPEHLRALAAGGLALVPALGRSLSIGLEGAEALASALGVDLASLAGGVPSAPARPAAARPPRPASKPGWRPRDAGSQRPAAAGGSRPPRRSAGPRGPERQASSPRAGAMGGERTPRRRPDAGPGERTGRPGGFGGKPGGFGARGKPGAFDRKPGGFDRKPGGFDRKPGGFDRKPGGFDRKPGGFDRKPGGFDRKPGGFDRKPGGFDRKPGGFRSGEARGAGGSGERRPGGPRDRGMGERRGERPGSGRPAPRPGGSRPTGGGRRPGGSRPPTRRPR